MVASENIVIILPGEVKKEYPKGITLLEISKDVQDNYTSSIVAAKVNNDIEELTYVLEEDARLEFIDLTSEDGIRIYSRSLSFVLIRAARELYADCRVTIEHSLSKGLYCELHCKDIIVKESDIVALEEKMQEIINADIPFIKKALPRDEVIKLFEEDGQLDKVRLLKHRKKDIIKVYSCGWMQDYFYGYMVPSTGYLKQFNLKYYLPGFILQYPRKEKPNVIPEYVEQPKLARIFKENEKWAKIIGVRDVGDLNNVIEAGEAADIIRLAEALQEKKIAHIADMITENRDSVRLVLIAGPSSSGKTTFAQRLSTQLRVNGLKPVSVSLDDYFVDREKTPIDEYGEPDFEALETIDVKLFNEHLSLLIQGEEVDIPTYNFHLGKREMLGKKLRVDTEHPIIIEGIHGLNEKLTESIPKNQKFKIYISALTHLNIDDHNRIPTTDSRIIRRIVRDNQFRSSPALKTLKMWASVRRGEEKNIFPFQEEADVMFNSALIYELAVLKKYAEPLLKEIDQSYPEYSEAKRLLKFLGYFRPLDDKEIPLNSILREFTGNSCFYR